MDMTEATCVTSSVISTHDHLMSMDGEKNEVSALLEESSGGAEKKEVEGKEEENSEAEGEGEVEEDTVKWGPLKVPVTLKIADLGNACWMVRGFVGGVHYQFPSSLFPPSLPSPFPNRISILLMISKLDSIDVWKC